VLVTGSPGGPTIINTVLEIITNHLDHGMPIVQAVEAPRFHHQWQPDVVVYDHYGMSPDTIAILVAEGHVLKERETLVGGDGETVAIDQKTHLRLGAADPRKPDAKSVGY
jgi:gamma-glutamyltranspeptidase/glutathione hydrolase